MENTFRIKISSSLHSFHSLSQPSHERCVVIVDKMMMMLLLVIVVFPPFSAISTSASYSLILCSLECHQFKKRTSHGGRNSGSFLFPSDSMKRNGNFSYVSSKALEEF